MWAPLVSFGSICIRLCDPIAISLLAALLFLLKCAQATQRNRRLFNAGGKRSSGWRWLFKWAPNACAVTVATHGDGAGGGLKVGYLFPVCEEQIKHIHTLDSMEGSIR